MPSPPQLQPHILTMGSQRTYQYSPLQDGHIRILCLQPGQGDEPLAGRLDHVRLQDIATDPESPNESFEALSYVWGGGSKEHELLIDSHGIAVTASLESALGRLRLPDRERRLWADAVCINQFDTREKEKQVRLMGEIYSSARLVVADLGEASEDSDAALDLIDRFWRTGICNGAGDPRIGRPLTPAETATFMGLSPDKDVDMAWLDHELPRDDADEWLPVIRFFQRPWFVRIWIIQEFILARNVLFSCGTRTIDWRHLFSVCIRFQSGIWMATTAPIVRGVTGTEEGIGRYIFDCLAYSRALRLLQRMPERRQFLASLALPKRFLRPGFIDLLRLYRSSKCTISRDRYFALLSIASDAEVLAKCPELQPDYTTADADWHLRTSHLLLQMPHGRDAFCYAGLHDNVQPETPSWSQRFPPAETDSGPFNLISFDDVSRAAGMESCFVVSAIPEHPDLISLKGYRVDRIATSVLAEEDIREVAFYRQCKDYVRRAAETYLSTMDVVDMDKRALEEMTMGIIAHSDPSRLLDRNVRSLSPLVIGMYLVVRGQGFAGPPGWEERMSNIAWVEYGKALSVLLGVDNDASKASQIEQDEDDEPPRQWEPDADFYGQAALPVFMSLNPGTTDKGSFVNVPSGSSVGDEIWVISGCRLPAVLRPSIEREGMHRLIGFGYATGVMRGEVLQREGFAWQDVLIY